MTISLTPPRAGYPFVVLAVIASATLMIVLDASIINIALPRAQAGLGLSDTARPWVITAYALSFGELLLLGGRLGDRFGHRRMFLLGITGFALASGLGGAAASGTTLILARALQGVFGAILAPAALALLTTTFTSAVDRARAFAVYGAVQGLGGAVGLLLGGVLTAYLGWRWCFYINLPIALVVALAELRTLPPGTARDRSTLDLYGALLSVGGLAAVVYGLTVACKHWRATARYLLPPPVSFSSLCFCRGALPDASPARVSVQVLKEDGDRTHSKMVHFFSGGGGMGCDASKRQMSLFVMTPN